MSNTTLTENAVYQNKVRSFIDAHINDADKTWSEMYAIKSVKIEGGFDVLYIATGEPVTRIDYNRAKRVYPIGSEVSAAYEHADGIILDMDGCERLDIYVYN